MKNLTFLVFLHSSKFMSIHKFSSTTLHDFKCMDCFFKYEAQISRPYRRWGLTNAVESFWKSWPSRYHKLQRTIRTTTFVEIYSLHLSQHLEYFEDLFAQRHIPTHRYEMLQNNFLLSVKDMKTSNFESVKWSHF